MDIRRVSKCVVSRPAGRLLIAMSWLTVNLGRRWCVMASRVGNRVSLICAENTVICSAQSCGELIAAIISQAVSRISIVSSA